MRRNLQPFGFISSSYGANPRRSVRSTLRCSVSGERQPLRDCFTKQVDGLLRLAQNGGDLRAAQRDIAIRLPVELDQRRLMLQGRRAVVQPRRNRTREAD